ncbi:hypothetical protein FAUST_2628 [Fusarium austroamericanum]|uniref:Uncharacterized protein n=1 Tax=Fusarium austroamericanum TaxID=282268 RepID=A0AAN6C6J4_FUSAU|nr:hypothetical protein FAUST_2628 [Fusarium austroamericanum]
MPSFNPLDFFCCRKSRWRGSGSSAPATQDTTPLQPVPSLLPRLEEQQEEPGPTCQNTLMGLSDMVWVVPEDQSSFESDSVTNQHIDSDSDSFISDRDLPRSTKPGTPFGAVRKKIIRSISHNNSSDQPSRISVGNSEEEVARRAELRRIMRLRIRDQLESDEAEDQLESKPTISIRRVASSADSSPPVSGPRDAIEFGVNNSSSSNGQPARLDQERRDHGPPEDLGGPQKSSNAPERASSEQPDVEGRNDDSSEDAVIQRPSPIHPSAHISMADDLGLSPSQKSFQLSNRSGRLDRILGPDSSFNNRQASSGDGQSALGVWLIAQGLRSRDNSDIFFDEDEDAQTRNVNGKAAYSSPVVGREKSLLASGTQATPETRDCHQQGSAFVNPPRKLDPQCQLEPSIQKDFDDNLAFSGEIPWGSTTRSHGVISNVQSEADAASMAQSESASFVQREAELRTIKRRFSEALTQKNPEKTVFTRFREDFSHSGARSPVKKPSTSNVCLTIPTSHFRAKSEGSIYRHDERSSPNSSKWLIERWVSQMRPRSTHPTESVTSVGLVGPPRSWSKFPSFNREERNRNITSRDEVRPRDFAVKHVTSEGQIRWATDTGSGRDDQQAHTLPRSLSTRFGGLVKSKMNRMMPSKTLRHRMSQVFISRSVTSSPPHMEYPEMGIRPTESGYTEIQAMGREINYMKGRAHLQTPERDLSKPHSSRSLGDRVVALMHEAIGQRHPKHDEPLQLVDIPMVPFTPSLARQSIAATTTDFFVTPKSHLSDDGESDEEKNGGEGGSAKAREREACQVILGSDRTLSNPLFTASIAQFDNRTHSSPENRTPGQPGVAQEE